MGLTPITQVGTPTCCRCRLCVLTPMTLSKWTIKRSAGVLLSMPLISNGYIAHKLPQLFVRLEQLAHKLTVHVSMQGMSSAGQKRSPPNELERQVSTDQAADESVCFAASCYWPCAESMVKLKTNSQPCLQDSPFQGEEVKRQKATQSASIVTYRLLCPGSRTGSIIGKVIGQVSFHCLTYMLMTWQHTDRVARSYASYGMRLAPRSRLRTQHLSAKTEL